jgi:hypothetical protein
LKGIFRARIGQYHYFKRRLGQLESDFEKLSTAKIQNVLRKEHYKALYIKTCPLKAPDSTDKAYESLTLTPVLNEKECIVSLLPPYFFGSNSPTRRKNVQSGGGSRPL